MTEEEKAEYKGTLKNTLATTITWTAWIRGLLRNCVIAVVLFFCCWGFGLGPAESARIAAGVMAMMSAGMGCGVGALIVLVVLAIAIIPDKKGTP